MLEFTGELFIASVLASVVLPKRATYLSFILNFSEDSFVILCEFVEMNLIGTLTRQPIFVGHDTITKQY